MPKSLTSIAFVLVPLALATLPAAAGQEKWMGWYFKDFDPAGVESSTLVTTDDYKLARNIWSHVTRFYAVLESKEFEQLEDGFTDITLSQNMPATKLPVRSAPAFLANLETAWVNGTTLWLDYSFPAFPENVGHWMEMLLPVYSQLSLGKWKEQLRAGEDLYIGACIFPNLRRGQVQGVPWVVDMVKLALGPGLPPGKELPIVLFYDELEQLNATMWTGFERILYIQDRYTHPTGRNGFATQELGRQFRDAAYRHVNFSRHDTWDQGIPPPTITYLMANGGEQVVNNGDILASLQDLGSALGFRVRPYTVTSQAPFSSYVASMAKTGVLVARHGPLLGNTIFLPPGALVLELLPYNWEWKRISEMYYNMTRSLGDIHHFAWRATSSQWAVYNPPEDVKYSHWTIEECSSKYCLEAHARAGMIADVGSVHEILLDLLPSVMRGEAVDTLRPRRPWPTIKPEGDGHTGLWWDVQ